MVWCGSDWNSFWYEYKIDVALSQRFSFFSPQFSLLISFRILAPRSHLSIMLLIFRIRTTWTSKRSHSFGKVNGKYCEYCWMRNELEIRTTNDIRLNRWRRFVCVGTLEGLWEWHFDMVGVSVSDCYSQWWIYTENIIKCFYTQQLGLWNFSFTFHTIRSARRWVNKHIFMYTYSTWSICVGLLKYLQIRPE